MMAASAWQFIPFEKRFCVKDGSGCLSSLLFEQTIKASAHSLALL